jgi:hypothetical protein
MKSTAPTPAAPPSPLAQLNAHIAQAARAASEAAGEGVNATSADVGQGAWPELRSTRRFRQTWERLSAEMQVQHAQARAPLNAGPLNPQRLMIDTLARMGELSPHYLHRFLAHAQTLLWLEQVQAQLTAHAPGKAGQARASRSARHKP